MSTGTTPLHITDNPYLNPVTLPHVLHFWQKPYHNLFIPVSYTAYALLALSRTARHALPDAARGMSPYDPHVFHAANLVLHLLNVLLVFRLLRRIVKNPWAALGGALLFGLHPVQVESVAWISELRGLLGSFFALLGPVALSSVRVDAAGTRKTWPTALVVRLALSPVSCWPCCPSPARWSMPVFALLLDAGSCAEACAPLCMACRGGDCGPRLCADDAGRSARPRQPALPLWQRPFIAGDALAFYFAKMLLPLRLGIDYGRSPLFVLDHAWGYLTWLVPVGLGLLLWLLRRRYPMLCLAAALFVAGLLPALGLVPFLFQDFSTVTDRYLYLSLLGPALALAWALSRTQGRAAPVLSAVALIALAGRSVTQIPTWTTVRRCSVRHCGFTRRARPCTTNSAMPCGRRDIGPRRSTTTNWRCTSGPTSPRPISTSPLRSPTRGGRTRPLPCITFCCEPIRSTSSANPGWGGATGKGRVLGVAPISSGRRDSKS